MVLIVLELNALPYGLRGCEISLRDVVLEIVQLLRDAMLSIGVLKESLCYKESHSLTISCGARDEPREGTTLIRVPRPITYPSNGWGKPM